MSLSPASPAMAKLQGRLLADLLRQMRLHKLKLSASECDTITLMCRLGAELVPAYYAFAYGEGLCPKDLIRFMSMSQDLQEGIDLLGDGADNSKLAKIALVANLSAQAILGHVPAYNPMVL